MNLPAPFTWEARDAGRIRCTDCGETLHTAVMDLHLDDCTGGSA